MGKWRVGVRGAGAGDRDWGPNRNREDPVGALLKEKGRKGRGSEFRTSKKAQKSEPLPSLQSSSSVVY